MVKYSPQKKLSTQKANNANVEEEKEVKSNDLKAHDNCALCLGEVSHIPFDECTKYNRRLKKRFIKNKLFTFDEDPLFIEICDPS